MGHHSSKLHPDVLEELTKETDFRGKDIEEWHTRFLKDFPDEKLTLDDFKKIYKKFFPHGDASTFAESIFKIFDTNEDGSVNFREFIIGLSVMSRGTVEARLRLAFGVYDRNGDGFVSRQEALEVFKAVRKMEDPDKEEQANGRISPGEMVESLFQRLDANHDGQLTVYEFVNGAKNDPKTIALLNAAAKE